MRHALWPQLAICLACLPLPTQAQAPGIEQQESLVLVDRIVAVVDEDPIFLSDIRQAQAFTPELAGVEPRLILEQLIEQRLRSHEVDRYGNAGVTDSQVEQQVQSIERTEGPRLRSLGIDREALSAMVRRQLRVLLYVEERLGTLVSITDAAVRGYYESTFRDEMIRLDQELPPLEDVAEAIGTLLREQALDARIEQWTQDLRERAEIEDLLDLPLPLDQLPRGVLRIEPSLDKPPDQ